MKPVISRALGILLLIATTLAANAEGIKVSDPWLRAAPPNAPTLAAFMKLENHSAADITLQEVRSTLAVKRIELHRTVMSDGLMKMVPQKVIPVPAHGATTLEPGSWHIMLVKPAEVPVVGDKVELTLVFSNGSEQTVIAPVRKGMKMMKGSQSHQAPGN